MIPLILGFVGSMAIAELYKRYAKPSEKKQWEKFVRMHHGEAGIIMTALGIAAKSPTLVGSGLGLVFHDKKDSKRWFKQ